MKADAIVIFFCDVGGQPILQLSDYNWNFSRVFLLFSILLISIVCIGLCLIDVIIVHLTPQLAAYSGQQYFKALVEEVINAIICGKKRLLKIYNDDFSASASPVLYRR